MTHSESCQPEYETIDLVKQLLDAVNTRTISYCHWKSNNALDATAIGINDIDILIDRRDADKFREILAQLAFKEAIPSGDDDIPGIENLFGYDRASCLFVHAHVHYHLVVGSDLSKNYHLPLEEAFLTSATPLGQFYVPDPNLEYVMFVIRMVLKFSLVTSMMGSGSQLSRGHRDEFVYLQERISPEQIREVLERDVSFLDRCLFVRCIESLQPNASLRLRWQVRRELKKALAAFARRPSWRDDLHRLKRRLMTKASRWLSARGSAGKRLKSGGVLIALVGSDGSGKSTLINEIDKWLSGPFSVSRMHMGKPQRSIVTRLVDIVLRTDRAVARLLGRRQYRPTPLFPHHTMQCVRSWLLARDRHRAFARARRLVASGDIVLCDRYPFSFLKTMDGPNVRRLAHESQQNTRLTDFLAKREERYYKRMTEPDVLLVLAIDPEIAAQRKPGHNKANVIERANEINCIDWQPYSAIVLDASLPEPELHRTVKELVWPVL